MKQLKTEEKKKEGVIIPILSPVPLKRYKEEWGALERINDSRVIDVREDLIPISLK